MSVCAQRPFELRPRRPKAEKASSAKDMLAAIDGWRSSDTESKMIRRPCLKHLSLGVEFFHHAIDSMVTGIVS